MYRPVSAQSTPARPCRRRPSSVPFALTALLLACLASPARADIVTIDPNDYAIGTDLSQMFTGLEMRQVISTSLPSGPDGPYSAELAYLPILVDQHYYGSDLGLQTMGFGYELLTWESYSQSGPGRFNRDWIIVELLFSAPTDFVELSAAWFSDSPVMFAFDQYGSPIGDCYSSDITCASSVLHNDVPNAPWTTTMTLSRPQSDIARIVFGGYIGGSALTGVRYSVPEPASLSLLAAGLVLAGVARRRRR